MKNDLTKKFYSDELCELIKDVENVVLKKDIFMSKMATLREDLLSLSNNN